MLFVFLNKIMCLSLFPEESNISLSFLWSLFGLFGLPELGFIIE